MSLLIWIIFGAIVGWVASKIAGTEQGIVLNVLIGIVGAFLGGFLMSLFGKSGVTGFNLYSAIVAIIGALVLITAYRALART